MTANNENKISQEEMIQSQKRASKLEKINQDLQDNKDSEMAKILAMIEEKNKKKYEE